MSQNLLSNVFRPTYVYDTVSNIYSSRLELVNIDTVSANVILALTASIGDAAGNVYVGTNAGNPFSNILSNSNVTALGMNAGSGSSNSSNSIFIGFGAGLGSVNSCNTIAIGVNTIASGSGNIYMGTNTGSASGTSNIFIGQNIAPTGVVSNTLLIGNGATSVIDGVVTENGILISGVKNGYLVRVTDPVSGAPYNYSCNAVGINTAAPYYTLDVNGYARIGTDQNGGLGINTNPLDYTLNVNGDMQVTDGYGVLRFTHDMTTLTTCNVLMTLDTTPANPQGTATLGVTGGIFSSRGVTVSLATGTSAVIGTWKNGLVYIYARDVSGYVNFWGGTVICLSASMGIVSNVASNVAYSTITASTSNIVLRNTASSNVTYTYMITYFPSMT